MVGLVELVAKVESIFTPLGLMARNTFVPELIPASAAFPIATQDPLGGGGLGSVNVCEIVLTSIRKFPTVEEVEKSLI
jgi:hypothetical protein